MSLLEVLQERLRAVFPLILFGIPRGIGGVAVVHLVPEEVEQLRRAVWVSRQEAQLS